MRKRTALLPLVATPVRARSGWALLTGLLLLAVPVSGCFDIGSGSPPAAEDTGHGHGHGDASPGEDGGTSEVTVEMTQIKFIPEEITVEPGTRVVWIHNDGEDVPHTIKAGLPDEDPLVPWESPVLETGGEYGRVFEKPGTHDYYCTIHPIAMQAKVIVEQ